MTGKTAAVNHDQGNSRPKLGQGRSDPAALAQGLERLREELLQRLEIVESVAAEQAALGGYSPTDRELILKERASTLEASLARLQAELKRREHEWEEKIQSLEHDRRLIAEAWKRLEAEQIEGGGGPPDSARESPAAGHAPNGPAYHAPAPDESNDVVTKAILKQFQAMQGDVRRNAKGRTTR